MLACLWPWATALGNGSVLETHSLFRVCLENSLFAEKWGYTLLRWKKFLLVPPKWGEEGQDPVQFSMWEPRWDSQQSSFFGAIKQGKVAYPLLQHSQCNCLTHTCSIVRDCAALGWSGSDFSFTDILTMDGSGSLQASFQQWAVGLCFS